MRKIICTNVIGPAMAPAYHLTLPAMQEYAERIGADFYVKMADKLQVGKPRYDPFSKYNLLQDMNQLLADQVLYLDADVYVRRRAPNIFDHYPSTHGVWLRNEVPHPEPSVLGAPITWIRENFAPDWPENRYYSAGVMLFGRTALADLCHQLRSTAPRLGVYGDQDQLNYLLAHEGPVGDLGMPWNTPTGAQWRRLCRLEDAYFIHGTGGNPAYKWVDLAGAIKANP